MKNSKKIKIYLQYPWKYADSPYYKYLLKDVDPNLKYIRAKGIEKGATHNKTKLKILYTIKKYLRRILNRFKLAVPNAHLSPRGDYNLIHCAHCLSKNRDKPWVVDVEGVWSLSISNINHEKSRKKVDKYLTRENCKKVLPWLESVRKELEKKFPKIKDKLEVVYPAVPEKKGLKRKPLNKINLLFVARYFYQKGGVHTLEAMDKLTKKYKNVYGTFISPIPEEIMKKYSSNKKIKFSPLVPQKKLFEIYEKSHVLLYPGYSDSFGFAYLEAMSFGIPIVSVDKDYRKEIIAEGKTGFLVKIPKNTNWQEMYSKLIRVQNGEMVNKLAKATEKLIENPKLLKKMSKNCLKEIKDGKFSIKERNKKLKRIYEEALN